MKAIKKVMIVLGCIILIVITALAYVQFSGIPKYEAPAVAMKVEVTPERVEQGRKIGSILCITCHAADDGRMTGKELPEMAELGKIYSKNITHDPLSGIGKWTDGELYSFMRTGIKPDGQYVPIYMPKFPLMSDEDLKSVIAWLRSDSYPVQASPVPDYESEPSFLTKFLSHAIPVFKPFPLPDKEIVTPDSTNKVALGKYLTAIYDCYMCHSQDYMKLNLLEPEKSEGYFAGGMEMETMKKEIVYASNLTFDVTGIAHYTEEEFINTVKHGRKPDGTMVKFPMLPKTALEDYEVAAIYAYLQTVPKINNTPGNK
jgi:mono/diheme cytochrome c family protein